MLAAIVDRTVPVLLDIGTGTGRVLEIFADRISDGLGLDLSQQMLDLARSRLDQLGLRNCAVRQGNVYDIAVSAGSVDVAVLHHVLHFLDDPAAAIAEAARTLRPGGQILLVDFASHDNETMRTEFAHHWLGFTDDEVERWCTAAGLVSVRRSTSPKPPPHSPSPSGPQLSVPTHPLSTPWKPHHDQQRIAGASDAGKLEDESVERLARRPWPATLIRPDIEVSFEFFPPANAEAANSLAAVRRGSRRSIRDSSASPTAPVERLKNARRRRSGGSSPRPRCRSPATSPASARPTITLAV